MSTANLSIKTPSNIFQNFKKVDNKTITFTLSPTDVAYANTLRRMILTGVQTVAFRSDMDDKGRTTNVMILSNSTPMTNEMLADRIGLIPISVRNPHRWNPDRFQFKLAVNNPNPEPMDVTTDMIQVFEIKKDGTEVPIKDGNRNFFHPDEITGTTALLAILKGKRPGQKAEEIVLEATATTGYGREHARFIPVSQCAYRYTRDDDDKRRDTMFKNWLAKSKKETRELEKIEAEKLAAFKREYDTMEIDRCYLQDGDGEPYSFDFTVESIGTMDPELIVQRALQSIITMCAKYATIYEALPQDMRKAPADARMEGFDFTFMGQDHTLGNLLQSYIDLNLLDSTKVTYVGYKIPHPLRDEMVLRIGVAGGQEVDARRVVSSAADGCAKLFSAWLSMWESVAKLPPEQPITPVVETPSVQESSNTASTSSNTNSNTKSNSNKNSNNSNNNTNSNENSNNLNNNTSSNENSNDTSNNTSNNNSNSNSSESNTKPKIERTGTTIRKKRTGISRADS